MWITLTSDCKSCFLLCTEFGVFTSYGLLQMFDEEDNDELSELPSCDPFRTAEIQEVLRYNNNNN